MLVVRALKINQLTDDCGVGAASNPILTPLHLAPSAPIPTGEDAVLNCGADVHVRDPPFPQSFHSKTAETHDPNFDPRPIRGAASLDLHRDPRRNRFSFPVYACTPLRTKKLFERNGLLLYKSSREFSTSK